MLAFLSLVSLQLSDNQNSQHSLHCVTMSHLHLYTPDNPPPLGLQGFMVFWSRLPVLPVLSCLFFFVGHGIFSDPCACIRVCNFTDTAVLRSQWNSQHSLDVSVILNIEYYMFWEKSQQSPGLTAGPLTLAAMTCMTGCYIVSNIVMFWSTVM